VFHYADNHEMAGLLRYTKDDLTIVIAIGTEDGTPRYFHARVPPGRTQRALAFCMAAQWALHSGIEPTALWPSNAGYPNRAPPADRDAASPCGPHRHQEEPGGGGTPSSLPQPTPSRWTRAWRRF
jgi:hypothetical protein